MAEKLDGCLAARLPRIRKIVEVDIHKDNNNNHKNTNNKNNNDNNNRNSNN